MTYLTYSSSFLMEHRSSTSTRHLTLFCAVSFASHHVSPLSSNSDILCVSRCRGLPLLRSFPPPPRMLLPILHLLSHLGTLAQLKHCPYVPLSDLHTRFWRQQFHRQFKCHSLPRTLIQPGINILYLCFPTVGRSGNTSFGFCNAQVLWERVISPPPNPQPGGPGDHSSSGLYPLTFSAWVALPGV